MAETTAALHHSPSPAPHGAAGAVSAGVPVRSEDFYRRLVESVSDYAIYMIDPNGMVSSWNRGAQRFKGYEADEIIGRHFSAFYTPEDRAIGKPATALETARTQGRFEDRAWRIRKDGRRFRAHVIIDPLFENDVLVGYAKITRDISETYEQELRLRESERRFRLLVSSVTDYAIYMLDLDGRISSWNAGAERFKQYTEDEILGQHFSRFYTDADAAAGRPMRALRIALGEGRFEDVGWRVRKGGEAFWAHVIIDVVRNEQGDAIGFAKITRDISEQREVETRMRDLVRANEELEQFIQVASHDLREPLRKVLAFSDLLEMDLEGQLSEGQLGYIHSITSATRRMQGLLDSLLSLTKITAQGNSFSPCDLNASIAEVCADLEVKIQETGTQIKIGTLPTIQADPNQMRQLFQNLIENSIKYRKPEQSAEIAIREIDSHDPAQVSIEVSDNGIGFEPRYAERIFGIFQRLHTRDQYSGAGVGLAVCRKICVRHGGSISAMSEPGQGARFVLLLGRTFGAQSE